MFQDRVALSVYFMFSQDKFTELQNYFDRLIDDECIKSADLHGILLTGLGPRSIDLFQAFIDKTSDIQTASLAIIHSPYLDVLNSKQVQYWINCYRDQLNRFKYWERRQGKFDHPVLYNKKVKLLLNIKRAEFDVLKMKLIKSQNLVYSSPAAQSESTLVVDQNNSQSSSSSFISINQTTPTRSHMPQSNTFTSMASSSNNSGVLNRSNTMTSITSTHSMTQFNYQRLISGNTQKPSQAPNQNIVHLICNKCGVSVSNKLNMHADSNFSIS